MAQQSPKVIVIYGATGAQGGAIARSMLANPRDFSVRAITRNPDSEKASQLANLGADVVKANSHNLDDMRRALQGAWGFWLNTDHHDSAVTQPGGITSSEFDTGLISLASECGVKVLINSTTISSRQFTNGRVTVPGMEAKNGVFNVACSSKFKFEHVIGVMPGWYMENFLSLEYRACFGGFPAETDDEGYLTFRCPQWGGSNKIPFLSVTDDFGDMVHGMFLNPSAIDRKIIPCYSDTVELSQLTKDFEKMTGKPSRYLPYSSPDDFPTHGVPMLIEIQDIFKFTQANNGAFFGHPNDNGDALKLAKAAMARRGGQGSVSTTLNSFMANHFMQRV